MASHNERGVKGEDLAEAWLKQQGYSILYRNWRYTHYEIDLIASKDGTLHIVEVKCHKYSPFGYPEDRVTKKKFKHLQQAADHFLLLHPGYDWIQYDVLAITVYEDKEPEYFLLEDIFL
jgi:putative endonuclease